MAILETQHIGRLTNALQVGGPSQRVIYDMLEYLQGNTLLNSGGLVIKAGGNAAAKTANAVYAFVNGVLVKKAAGDMAALSGTVSNAAFNVFCFYVNAAGTLSTVMGTEGASLAAVTFPPLDTSKVMIGFVIINPTGTGDFVGGTTALDDGTVVPNAVYINTVQPLGPALYLTR
jgi:hypothetical protein